MRLPTDKARSVAATMKRIHPASDLGAKHDGVARDPPKRRSAAMFCQPVAIKRRGIQKIDAERKRPVDGADRRRVVELCIEITERCGPEPQNGHIEAGASERPAR